MPDAAMHQAVQRAGRKYDKPAALLENPKSMHVVPSLNEPRAAHLDLCRRVPVATRLESLLDVSRPRGIRYQKPLQDMIGRSTGFLSCWRKLMVLGPAHEFAVVGFHAVPQSS